MQIIMGGSSSTGSSLLKNILNRNQRIFSGGKTSFFAKKMIYENWDRAKSRVLKRRLKGLRNHGWHIYNGTDLLQKEYRWVEEDLEHLLKESKSLQDFTSFFFQKPLALTGADIWLEKTPANSACFSSFLHSYEAGKVIHIVRNPYDTIASLLSRGFDLYYSLGIYLLNSACGVSVKDSERSITVKYEDLISKPEETIRSICNFLDVTYSVNMLKPQGEVVYKSKLKGWNYNETESIGNKSVGRYNRLSEEDQNAIMEAVNMVRINRVGQAYYETEISSVQDVCEVLEYDFYNIGKTSIHGILKKQKRKDRWNRVCRGYPNGFYYPLDIYK